MKATQWGGLQRDVGVQQDQEDSWEAPAQAWEIYLDDSFKMSSRELSERKREKEMQRCVCVLYVYLSMSVCICVNV